MRNLSDAALFAFLTLTPAAFAGDISLSAEEAPSTIVNQSGKRRALENMKIVDQNIEDAKFNLGASKRNAEAVQTEIEKLNALQREHVEMIEKYTAYLREATPKVAANLKELKELESIEKKMGKPDASGNISPELERLRREKLERMKWDSESRTKVLQIQKFQSEADRNLKDIASRLKPLQEQYKTWMNRQKEFEDQLEKYAKRKVSLERQIGSTTAVSSSTRPGKGTDSRPAGNQ